jgi:uncharacterized protein (DUF1015 family)
VTEQDIAQADGPRTPSETASEAAGAATLALRPFRALRPVADGDALAALLCPPYDVIDSDQRARLLAREEHNAVALVLPQQAEGVDEYLQAATDLARWTAEGRLAVDPRPALYVYEMRDGQSVTRGLLGALELRAPAAGVVLPHENTMAGPVADRLALMRATEANLEPIYLVYDGGGPASELVREADRVEPLAHANTADGISHRLWAVTDADAHAAVARDLAPRRALIADGHHRYATYLQLQTQLRAARGAGPWDRGLTLLVDSSSYGPAVHAIHRVLPGLPIATACERLHGWAELTDVADAADGLARLDRCGKQFAAVLTDGIRAVLVRDADGRLPARARQGDEPPALAELDVTVLHRVLVPEAWQLPDSVDTVGYAHSVDEATAAARQSGGTAVLLRPTPVAAVAAVAAAGARMPRKSTLFTPKPASGLVLRRWLDDWADERADER